MKTTTKSLLCKQQVTQMLNLHYLYAKIGPICAVGQCFENKLQCIDVWDASVDEETLTKKYKNIKHEAWIKYDKREGFVSNYNYAFAPKTALQKDIVAQLCLIPVGETRSYQEIAKEVGNRFWARAVGSVCSSNPFPLVVPCHRVVGLSNPWAYSGGMLEGRGAFIKKALLEFEQHSVTKTS